MDKKIEFKETLKNLNKGVTMTYDMGVRPLRGVTLIWCMALDGLGC